MDNLRSTYFPTRVNGQKSCEITAGTETWNVEYENYIFHANNASFSYRENLNNHATSSLMHVDERVFSKILCSRVTIDEHGFGRYLSI